MSLVPPSFVALVSVASHVTCINITFAFDITCLYCAADIVGKHLQIFKCFLLISETGSAGSL